ncbi:MAG: PTPDL family protein [Verrucomicrobiota bacterium]
MKTVLASLIIATATLGLALADTIILKSGEQIEGTIKSETDASIVVEIQVTNTIKDQKTIQRTDIERIDKLTPDGAAWDRIENYIPTPPLLTLTEYQGRIAETKRFIDRFPDSTHKGDAEEILITLQGESEKAAKGFIKVGDSWISPEDREKDTAAIDAQITLHKMKTALANEQAFAVLRDFETMNNEYRGTMAFVPALDVAQEALKMAAGNIQRALGDFAYAKEQRESKWALMPETERMQVEKLYNDQQAVIDAKIAAEKKERVKWVTVNPESEASLKSAAETIKKEVAALAGYDKGVLQEGADLIVQARAAADAGQFDEARTILAQAGEEIGRTNYLTLVQNNIKADEDAEREARRAAADAAQNTRSQEALADMKRAGEETDTTNIENVAADPLAAQRERRKAAMEKENPPEKKSTPSTPSTAQKSAAVTRPTPPPAASSGGGGFSFSTLIMILAGIMVAVTLGAIVMKKKQGG